MKKYTHREAVSFVNEQYWHDSVLHEIRIIRTSSADQVDIILDLIVNADDQSSEQCTLSFNDCYLIETHMNGGVGAISDGEMIYTAEAKQESPLINQVVKTWEQLFEVKNLLHFSMSLSSTDSKIEIVCKSITQNMGKNT